MARYGKSAMKTVGKALHEMKRGKLKSGRSGATVKSRKQAIAIGLSQARRKGAKVPAKGRDAPGRPLTRRRPGRRSAGCRASSD